MAIFSTDLQRRVRLRHATKFDLGEVLGEPLVIYVGELPQSEQNRLLDNMDLRALVREQRAGEPGAELDEKLAMKALMAQQALVGAALLDERGDRLRPDDVAMLFDLIPATEQGIALTANMLEAVYRGIIKEKPAGAPAAPGEPAAEEPAPKPGK